MQLLSCYIAVAGDDHSIVVRSDDTAVTYPELLVLRALHGSESVRNVADFGDVEREPADERERLANIYGRAIVDHVFPGEHTQLPEEERRRVKRSAKVLTDEDRAAMERASIRDKDPPGKVEDVLEPPDEKHPEQHARHKGR